MEVAEFFRALREGRAPRLSLLRTGEAIQELLLEHIQAESHPKGRILLKCNHLTDPALLEALARAADKGARVDLIVRSTLTLLHPRFRARSLVGRFLEHARVAAFYQGGRWALYLTSANLMPRNFQNRFELLFPVLDEEGKAKVLRGPQAPAQGRPQRLPPKPQRGDPPLGRQTRRSCKHLCVI